MSKRMSLILNGILAVLLVAGLVWIGYREYQIRNRRGRLSQTQTQVRELRGQVEDLRTRLEERTGQLEALREENRQVAEELRQKVDGAKVRKEDRAVVLELQETILFNLASAEVTPRGRRTLKAVASVLKKYPDREVRVEGHADTLPIQTEAFASNWELSTQRAVNVLKYLVYARGIDRGRIGATGFGQFRPVVPNTSPANRARNRRVEIVLLPPDVETEPVEVPTS